MPYQTKIATCSYCGSRQTLQLSARAGHELACGSCGAPLHEMKWLKTDRKKDSAKRSPRKAAPHGNPLRDPRGWNEDDRRGHKKKKRKKRKSLFREVVEEAFDVIEDIFD